MGIRVRRVEDSFGIWDSSNCRFIDAEHLGIGVERVREYLKEHPFPKDTKDRWYSEEYMIGDVTDSQGSLIISGSLEQAEWVAEMIQALL
jgi:hypothetical protein